MDLMYTSVVVGEMAAGLGAALLALRSGRPIWALSAIVAILLSVSSILVGPSPKITLAKGALQDISGAANFKTRYNEDPLQWGDEIGDIRQRSYLSAYTTYYLIEYHPEVSDVHWQVGAANLGDRLLQGNGLTLEQSPLMPKVILLYLEGKARRGVDILYYYGKQLTSPIYDGKDACEVYFNKAVLKYQCGNADADGEIASVFQEPLGTHFYQVEHEGSGILSPSPWTSARLLLLGTGGLLLLLAFVPLLVSRLRGDDYDFA